MIEPAEISARQPPAGRGAEVLLLVSLSVLCSVLGVLLHFAAEIPPATAALTALASLSILLATNAMVRRATTVAALNAEIKELRTEILGLRAARVPSYHSNPTARPMHTAQGPQAAATAGIGPSQQPMSAPRSPQHGDAPAHGQDASLRHPAHPMSGSAPRPTGPGYRATHQTATPPAATALSAAAAPASPGPGPSHDAVRQPTSMTTDGTRMTPGVALDWSVRPGSHREPTAPMFEVVPGQAVTGPLPVIEPRRQPAENHLQGQPAATLGHGDPSEAPTVRSSVEMTGPTASVDTAAATAMQPALGPVIDPPDRPLSSNITSTMEAAPTSKSGPFLDDLLIPESDGAPRAMARPDSGAWPQAVPKTPTAPLDLETMQNLIEQLAGQLESPTTNSSVADANPDAARAEEEARAATARSRVPPSLPQSVPHHAMIANQPRRSLARDGAAPFGHLALLAEAVEANRMDVLLDPILGLADRRARHFELSVRLISEDGEDLDPAQYRQAAAGTGLLGRIDAAKLAGAVNVLQRLRDRGSAASLFSAVAGESLSDNNFGKAFADILEAEEGRATRLVLTFSQSEARTFTDAHWRAVSNLSRIGLKFALTDVTDLDMDFEVLKRHGFGFIKLDALVFLDGLPTPTGHIPAADICRHLSNLGLALIVGGIVAEKDLARVLGFGAILGQGTLFGGPRSVELERERHAA